MFSNNMMKTSSKYINNTDVQRISLNITTTILINPSKNAIFV